MESNVVVKERKFWWRSGFQTLCLVAMLVLLGIYGHNIPDVVWVTMLGLLGATLGVGQSFLSSHATTVRTIYPPPMPMPPLPSIVTPTDEAEEPTVRDSPGAKSAGRLPLP